MLWRCRSLFSNTDTHNIFFQFSAGKLWVQQELHIFQVIRCNLLRQVVEQLPGITEKKQLKQSKNSLVRGGLMLHCHYSEVTGCIFLWQCTTLSPLIQIVIPKPSDYWSYVNALFYFFSQKCIHLTECLWLGSFSIVCGAKTLHWSDFNQQQFG